MRQGNGTDVLELNDPRTMSIGVLYVSAQDEAASVIRAIHDQVRQGRQQVTVVLGDAHKAFRHPEDFDELKRVRNGLQAQIVFIAPGGPGPAEFARQRRFQVYSSLENYTQALHDEQARQGQQVREAGTRKGWFFKGKRDSSVPVQVQETQEAMQNGQDGQVSQIELVGNVNIVEEKDSKAPVSRVRPIIIGGAERVDNSVSAKKSNESVQQDDVATGHENSQHVGPAIIDLRPTRTRGKETVKLTKAQARQRETVKLASVPVALPVAVGATSPVAGHKQEVEPVASSMTRQREQGMSGGVSAADISNVNTVDMSETTQRRRNRKAAGGLAAASLANTATGGTPPPTVPRNGGNGGGGGGRAGRRGGLLIGLVALLVLTGGVLSAIAFSNPNLVNSVGKLVKLQGSSTVTITPASKVESNNYIVVGVQGTPDASKQQVSARTVTGSSSSQSRTVNATGQKQTPGATATGTLTFTNGSGVERTVAAGTVFTGKDGVKVVNPNVVNVPAANPSAGTFGHQTASAHAVQVGAGSNIASGDISGYCCTSDSSISVVSSAFSGGQDPQNYTYVQQSDINGVVDSLSPSLIQQAQSGLKGQVRSNEQLAGPDQCSPSFSSDHNAGDKASTVAVTVSATCKGVVYDQKGALSLVTNLLTTKANSDLGSTYALVGNVVTTSKVQSTTGSDVSLLVSAKGVWVYQFSSSVQQSFKNSIAGKSVADATTFLKSQTGVSDVSFNPNSGTLPTNANDITFVIQAVQGLSGGGSSSGGGSMTPTVTGPGAGSSPTTQPGNG